MALTSAQVSVTTSATALNTAGGGQRLHLTNQGASAVVLGGSTVTTTTGYSLAASASTVITVGPGEILYGIVASGTVNVGIVRTGA